jgi:hypothetical protein
MGRIGMPEIIVILMIFMTSVVPLAMAVWAIITLQRIRAGQDAVRASLASIERLLQKT